MMPVALPNAVCRSYKQIFERGLRFPIGSAVRISKSRMMFWKSSLQQQVTTGGFMIRSPAGELVPVHRLADIMTRRPYEHCLTVKSQGWELLQDLVGELASHIVHQLEMRHQARWRSMSCEHFQHFIRQRT